MKILIIQQKMIGDVLISSLLCENIKKWNPSSEVDFVANRHTLPILENNLNIDNVIVFEDYFKKNKISFFKFLMDRQYKKYDFVIDAYGKTESYLTTWFTNAKFKIGYKKWYSKWVYSKSILRKHKRTDNGLQLTIVNRLELLKPIIGDQFEYLTKPKIYFSKKEKQIVKKKINEKCQPIIMISLMGSSKLKTYPLNKMSEIINFITKHYNVKLILNYLKDQENEAKSIFNLLSPRSRQSILNLTPNSLRDYILTVSQCDAIIGNEGGAINIAKALKLPSFSIFSPQINPNGWISQSSKEVGVHIMNYEKSFINFKLKNKEILRYYERFKFGYFKDELSIFLNQLK